jgi:peptidylprolyl isomerase
MSTAKSGDKVKVHYTGTLDDSSVFDSSREREPLEFTIGDGRLIPGFENAIVGMAIGDTKKVRLEPADAYGERRDDLTMEVEKSSFPEDTDPEVGQRYTLQRADGQTINVVIAHIKDDKVGLDANHPLAGKTLTFDLELVSIG